jgi:hypothetical protein
MVGAPFALTLSVAICVAACGSTSPGLLAPPTGQKGSPVKTACQGGKAMLFETVKAACSLFPPSPETRDSTFWAKARPCSRTIERNGMIAETTKYDYTKPYLDERATYDANGNIATFSLDEAFGSHGVKIVFDYDSSGLLTGEHIEGLMSASADLRYVFRYANGVRISEGVLKGDSYSPRWFYVYDASLRLIAEGPPLKGGVPPARYDESMLHPDAQGFLPVVPPVDATAEGPFFASIAFNTYFYDAQGRLRLQGWGVTPGGHMTRLDYAYDGDLLKTVKSSKNDSVDSTFGEQTWTYNYDCTSN